MNAIKAGNYTSWLGLTYNNAVRYCPSAGKTIKGHMLQNRQGVRSTRKLLLKPPETPAAVPYEEQADKTTKELGSKPNELHIHTMHTSKLYMDDTGRFPMCSRSFNQYIMVPYRSSNVTFVALFKTRKYQHRISAYNSIMHSLKDIGLKTYLQILDNEASRD